MKKPATLCRVASVAWALCPVFAAGQVYEEWDSAGVAVSVSGPDGATPWGVDPQVRIGLVDGADPYLFSYVWGAVRLPNGQVAVSEGQSWEIRVFGESGTHLTTFGGRGGGPEEFGGPPWIGTDTTGSIVAWDPGRYFMSRYSPGGELLDQANWSARVEGAGVTPFANGIVWNFASSGDLVWRGPARRGRAEEGVHESWSRLLVLPRDGAGVDLGDRLSNRVYRFAQGGGFRGVSEPIPPYVSSAVGQGQVAVGDSASWEVRLYDLQGRLRRIVRPVLQRDAVTRDLVREFQVAPAELASRLGISRRQVEEGYERLPLPDSVPAIGHLFFDRDGLLWVGRRTNQLRRAHEYHVFDTDGRWQGWVQLPEAVDQVLDVGSDYLLARIRDDFDVQFVQTYHLDRPDR